METWRCPLVLLLALPAVLSMAYQQPGSLMYPYGDAHGDMKTEKDDDGAAGPIRMSHSFNFFGEPHTECYVNNNGAISFKGPVAAYTPDSFPIPEYCMICPYWTDVDNECGGEIYYRQTTDKTFLGQISDDLNRLFTDSGEYSTKASETRVPINCRWAFIATWHEVMHHGTENNKTNTYQCVMAADGNRSHVMFNYEDIQWTTGTASGGDPKTGLGGTPAQCGFNTGKEYFNMPMSKTSHIVNIKSTSNVGVLGRWAFQVHDFKVPGGCMHQDSFLSYGQTIWSDESCGKKCSCKHNGKVQYEDKGCDEGLVCLPSGRHYMCQINEEDC